MASKTTDRWLSILSVDGQQSMLALHDAFWLRENCRILIGYAPNSRLFPLQIDELDTIEWALDPIVPTLEQMVEVFEKIQRASA